MKRVIAIAVGVALALPLVGVASAVDGPNMAQFKRLKARVVRLEGRVEAVETCFDDTFSITNHKGTSYAEFDGTTYSGSEPFDWFDTNPNPRTDPWVISQTTTTYNVVTDTC